MVRPDNRQRPMSVPTSGSPATPAVRITRANDVPVAPGGDFVPYWMTASRRTRWNFALQRAVEHGNALRLPLLVLTPLRAGYQWACDRFHRFVQTMIRLNDKYALDGRDPNSYTGILWVLGLHDRAWGPERPVFGKIRYMSSANTAWKYRVRGYVERYSGG